MVINMPEKLCPMCNQRVWVDNEDDVIVRCFDDGMHMTLRELKASTGIFHGEKKIVMDRCRHCPMREPRTSPNCNTYHVCTCPDTDGWEIEHLLKHCLAGDKAPYDEAIAMLRNTTMKMVDGKAVYRWVN